jgi:uncharacterized protein (DUF1015 family)
MMHRIEPFRGLLYDIARCGVLSNVVAPPYDLIDRARQDALYARSLYNVVRLELNRDPDPYVSAARTMSDWLREGSSICTRNSSRSKAAGCAATA